MGSICIIVPICGRASVEARMLSKGRAILYYLFPGATTRMSSLDSMLFIIRIVYANNTLDQDELFFLLTSLVSYSEHKVVQILFRIPLEKNGCTF